MCMHVDGAALLNSDGCTYAPFHCWQEGVKKNSEEQEKEEEQKATGRDSVESGLRAG